jgi:hypothetical protein
VTDRAELLATLEAAAAELPDATQDLGVDGAATWTRAGVRFAILRDAGVDLRVGVLIGAAAMHTPDAMTSAEGSDWVAFEPPELDDHALDRLRAWFAAAHRRAAAGDR